MNEQLRRWLPLGVVIGVVLAALPFWYWLVERVEVPSGHFLVRTQLWGKDLPPDEIIAPDASYKGIQLEVLPEGRHFLNPFFWSYQVKPMLNVPTGKCAVLTNKFGTRIPPERIAEGDLLAREGERGILRKVLLPGNYRINPYAQDVLLVDAIEIRAEQVGVRTLKVPEAISASVPIPKPGELRELYIVGNGQRGVQREMVPSGTYYLNPFVESIIPLGVRSHRVEFIDIEFPSRDGFMLKPHVLVTYRVDPKRAPNLFVMLSDEGIVGQDDDTPAQMAKNQLLQKIVLPLIRGKVRIEGSKYDARDFISVSPNAKDPQAENPRQVLQQALVHEVEPECQSVGILIESITLAEMTPPEELARQVAERELARVEREKNLDRIGQFMTEQELKAAEALKEQETALVAAQTRLIQAETKAKQRLAVEQAKLTQELASAQIRLEAARNQAQAKLLIGKAEASVIEAQNEAEVAGLRKAVTGFPTPSHFAQYHLNGKLAPALSEIFAADDSEFGKLFSSYLVPPMPAVLPKPKDVAGNPNPVVTPKTEVKK